jgi:LysR family transcriptional activator of nhaA
MVCKEGAVSKAAEALYLTPQTVTGQIKFLEERFDAKLLKRSGRSVEPTELGQLVFKYADRMFSLSYEMLDIVNYSQKENLLFDVGVADALSKRIVSQILTTIIPQDGSIHLRCFESTHEDLLERLSQHKLDMILSDCAVDSTQASGLYSRKLGEVSMSFYSANPVEMDNFPKSLDNYRLLIPGSRTSMGRKVMQWFDKHGIKANILGEFDDVALMKAFAETHPDTIFVAPTQYQQQAMVQERFTELSEVEDLKEEYFIIFAERMIQHPAVKKACEEEFKL